MAVAFPITAGQKLTAAVLNHMYAISDTAVTTVTAATAQNLSTVYVIPGNDMAAGVAYRLTASGDGQQGSTRQNLQFAVGFAGTSIGFQPIIDSTAFAVSALLRWKISIMLIPIVIGASLTFNTNIEGCVTQAANNLIPGTAANNTVPFGAGNITASTGDSTIANNFALRAQWGATTGAPTITCRATVFERLG
jgi:hypothetical protein